ncbi:ABC transporter substrate-binding protein [Undibacterium arcticum]
MQEAIEKGNALFLLAVACRRKRWPWARKRKKANSIFITYAGADEITGTECNRATFRWSAPTFGAIGQTVRPLLDKLPNAKRWYTITPQYVFGDGLLSAAKAVFKEKGH